MVEYKYLAYDDEGKIQDKLFNTFAEAFDYCQDGLLTFIDEIKYVDGVEDEEANETVWTWDSTWNRDKALAEIAARHKFEEDVVTPEIIDNPEDAEVMFTKSSEEEVGEGAPQEEVGAPVEVGNPETDFWITLDDIQAAPVEHPVEPQFSGKYDDTFETDFPTDISVDEENFDNYQNYIQGPADFLQDIAQQLGIADLVEITPVTEPSEEVAVEEMPVAEVPADVKVEVPCEGEACECTGEECTSTEEKPEEVVEEDLIATDAPEDAEDIELEQRAVSEIHKGKEEHVPNSVVEEYEKACKEKRDPKILECALSEAINDIDDFDTQIQIDELEHQGVECEVCHNMVAPTDIQVDDELGAVCADCYQSIKK